MRRDLHYRQHNEPYWVKSAQQQYVRSSGHIEPHIPIARSSPFRHYCSTVVSVPYNFHPFPSIIRTPSSHFPQNSTVDARAPLVFFIEIDRLHHKRKRTSGHLYKPIKFPVGSVDEAILFYCLFLCCFVLNERLFRCVFVGILPMVRPLRQESCYVMGAL